MDSFEFNKIAGAVLGTLLFAMGTGFIAELIYEPKPAGDAGYALPEPKPEGGGEASAEKKVEPIAVRLASADAEKGKAGTKPCQGCHSFDKGGPTVVGPNLWDVVERKKGGHEGFDYSAALKEKGGTWTYDDLDQFLTSPKGYIKGTKMAFAGITSPTDRANVIAYLRTLSDNPKPLPAAEKTSEGKAEGKPAEEGKKAEAGKPAGGEAGGFAAKVATASADKGKSETKPCQACHKFDKGGPNAVGPNLWGVVGRKKGSHEGYDYSAAMKAKGGEWTYDDLNAFLTKPSDYVKGTKMAFQGVASEDSRANIVAYLRTLSDNPVPIEAAAKSDAKPDAGAKPAETPAEAKPTEAKPTEAKPNEAKPAEAKPNEAKPADATKAEAPKPTENGDSARPVAAPDRQPERNEVAPTQAPEAKPADGNAAAKPEAPQNPNATVEPNKADPEAEKKAEESKPAVAPNNAKPAEDKPAQP